VTCEKCKAALREPEYAPYIMDIIANERNRLTDVGTISHVYFMQRASPICAPWWIEDV
jgi:hypothetical protein